MGQAINDICHMLDQAQAFCADAQKTKLTRYSTKLLKAQRNWTPTPKACQSKATLYSINSGGRRRTRECERAVVVSLRPFDS